MNPVEKLIERYGSHAAIGRKFRVTREAVRLWRVKGIPPERALEVEKAMAGEVSAIDILKFHQTAKKNS